MTDVFNASEYLLDRHLDVGAGDRLALTGAGGDLTYAADLPPDALTGVRLSASAGEPLPETLYRRWTAYFGVDILDGIGMTEMLHIFLSNREGSVRPGTTGVAVPGYDLRILDERGSEVTPGTPGTLYVRGSSTATGTGPATTPRARSSKASGCVPGTPISRTPTATTCLGRTNDMIKASGMWVAPAEVESRLLLHPAVGQAAVVAAVDADGLEKPVAYVVARGDSGPDDPGGLETEIIEFCRAGLPSFKRPRRVVFLDALPTTATGKVRRVELRAMAAGLLTGPSVQTGAR